MILTGKKLYSELEELEVINVINGKSLGTITDLEIEIATGRILSIHVSCNGLLSVFKKDEVYTIPYEHIMKIGEDVIIVRYSGICE